MHDRYSYKEIQDRIVREGYAAGLIYAICSDGNAYIGQRVENSEMFSKVDRSSLETMVAFCAELRESAQKSAVHIEKSRQQKNGCYPLLMPN